MHTIRLRRPWLRCDDLNADPVKVNVPDDAPAADATTVRYERKFNCPTGLEAADRVWLVVKRYAGSRIQIRLGSTEVLDSSDSGPFRIDLTPHLEPTNVLAVSLAAETGQTAVLDGALQLEIESVE